MQAILKDLKYSDKLIVRIRLKNYSAGSQNFSRSGFLRAGFVLDSQKK